jgi:hypothetical protein
MPNANPREATISGMETAIVELVGQKPHQLSPLAVVKDVSIRTAGANRWDAESALRRLLTAGRVITDDDMYLALRAN